MYQNRKEIYSQLEEKRDSKLLIYITGDRPGWETQIGKDVYDYFVNHLDLIGVVDKISLYLYTCGGDTLAAWSLVNLIQQFCSRFEVIIPSKAHSSGTLVCLGAGTIIMTKQATLGPIDPSVNTPLNPEITKSEAKVPVSVEEIKGFLELAKSELRIKGSLALSSILNKLTDKIHPLVLGKVYRTRAQIRMLAKKLIAGRIDKKHSRKVIHFLCSESGSHDYFIHRREARGILGLPVEKPNGELYALIKNIYDDIEQELQFNERFNANSFLGAQDQKDYSFKRALVESIKGGRDYFVSEGTYERLQTQKGIKFKDTRRYEGWRHEDA